jgi:SAM-dependent methyltransferase
VTLRVLQSVAENQAARGELNVRQIGYWPKPAPRGLFARLLRLPPVPVGDLNKSWDVLRTVQLVESLLPKDSPILDLGAYASEILCCLHLLGYRRLAGVDLNPYVTAMPFRDTVRYVQGDMTSTPFAEASMAAVTSISAIEHGVSLDAVLGEVARLLRPGGVFIGSTDYWPKKIDTSGILMYGQPWTIFSKSELERMFALAAAKGLALQGDCAFEVTDPAIECAGKHYTFAWFALIKR